MKTGKSNQQQRHFSKNIKEHTLTWNPNLFWWTEKVSENRNAANASEEKKIVVIRALREGAVGVEWRKGMEFYVFTMMSSECQPREQICNKIQNEGQIYLMGFHFCPWKYYLFLGYAFSFPLLKYKSNLLISNFVSKCDWMG